MMGNSTYITMQYFCHDIVTGEYGFMFHFGLEIPPDFKLTFKLARQALIVSTMQNECLDLVHTGFSHSTFLLMYKKIYNPSVTFKACRGVRLDTIIITFWSCSASDCKSQGCRIIEPQYPLYSSSSACCQGPGKKKTTHICATSEGDKALAELHRDKNVRNGRGLGELWSSRTRECNRSGRPTVP